MVLSALLMMLVSALTIESPVTTVYRIAPNAAAAVVIYPYIGSIWPRIALPALLFR